MRSGEGLKRALTPFNGPLLTGVTHGIGSAFGAMGEFTGKLLVKSVVHGLAQGIFTEAAGGKFSEGFAGGFAGSMIGNPAGKIDNLVLSTLVAAMVGGTVSELSGGKFRNGAKSAAMVHLFNQCAHVGCGSDESEEADSWPPKDYEKLTVDERREAWNRFVKEYDQISKGWNDPNFPGLPRLGDGWGKNLRRIVGKGVVEVFEFHDWGSEKSVYNLGTRSLEAFRAHPPIGNMKRDFMDWSTVRWENYDFGGPIKQTVDFHYWVNGRSDLRPADCYLTGGC